MDSPRFPPKSTSAPAAVHDAPLHEPLHEPPGASAFCPTFWPALLAALLPALGALAGCGNEAPLTTISYRLVGPPPLSAEGGCAVDEPAPGIDVVPDAGGQAPARIRLTYRDADTGALVCDTDLLPDGGSPVVAVPRGGPVDIAVEVFDTESKLLATGRARGVDLDGRTDVSIRVRPANAFSCAAARGGTPRAFHTATPLPGGRVLLAGGVTGGPEQNGRAVDLAGAGLFVTDSVELYDPVTETFTAVGVPGLIPRAMHEAHVFDSEDGLVHIALVGGVTASGDPAALPALVAGAGGLRLEPGASAAAAPVELLTYDPASGDITRERIEDGPAPRLLAASARVSLADGDRLVMVGGWDAAPLGEVDVIDPGAPAAGATTTTSAGRLGATVTDLGDGRALIWGGHLAEPIETRITGAGELLANLDSQNPTTSPPLFLGSAEPTARAFHTAVRTDDGSILMMGGFDITDSGVAVNPAAVFAQRLVVPGVSTDVQVSNVALVGGGTPEPAGFVGAGSLAGGDVLVSGGNPAIGSQGCTASSQGLVCALAAAYRYSTDDAAFVPTGGALLMGRYGHRQTTLPDGTVLVTGGLHAAGNDLVVLADAEIYEPAYADAPDGADGALQAPCERIETAAAAE